MAEFCLDTSAIGNEYQAYDASNVPTTWAVPEDGNGKAGPGHTAAVAISTIDVAGCTASGAGTISVLGVTVSSTLNATGAALATAIAAAINAASSAVSGSYSALLLPLNRLVYARVNPGTSTQVQIMLRIAGVDWNGVAPTQSGISAAATIVAFSGGANGPFAYWWNTSTVFGKVATGSAPAYGIFVGAPGSVTNPAATDLIHVRTKRSGVDLASGLYTLTNTRLFIQGPARTYIFDDGTTWAEGGTFQVTTYNDRSAFPETQVNFAHGTRFASRSKWGMKWTHNGAGSTGNVLRFCENDTIGHNQSMEFHNVWFAGGGSVGDFEFVNQFILPRKLFKGCRFSWHAKRMIANNGSYGAAWISRYHDCDLEYLSAISTPTGLVDFSQGNDGRDDTLFELIDSRFFFVSGGPITQLFTGVNIPSSFRAVIENCIGLRPEVLPALASDVGANRSLVFTGCADTGSGSIARSFVIDTGLSSVSWIDNGTYPYLNSQVPTGSYWSIRAVLKSGRADTVMSPIMRLSTLYRAADASKVITCEVLVPTGVSFLKSRLGLQLTFTDSTGAIQQVNTFESLATRLLGGTNALDSSGQTWSRATGYTAKKLSFDTASISKQIKSGTEIQARLVNIGDTPGTADRVIFINPELVLS